MQAPRCFSETEVMQSQASQLPQGPFYNEFCGVSAVTVYRIQVSQLGLIQSIPAANVIFIYNA